MMVDVRICENCNHKNPVSVLECEKCGYDLTFVPPVSIDPDAKPEKEDNHTDTISVETDDDNAGWTLSNVDNADEFFCVTDEISVGRDCDVLKDVFSRSNYTSRTHAKLKVDQRVLYVMDASTNGTYVNGKQINKLEWVKVEPGSIIKFADIAFRLEDKHAN